LHKGPLRVTHPTRLTKQKEPPPAPALSLDTTGRDAYAGGIQIFDQTMTQRRLNHIPCLDGIRAMAALMVMGFHLIGHHGEPQWLVHASVLGQTGVDLFFVLSGFLITRILLSSRGSPNFFSSFYMRRVLRIFPLYYSFLALYFYVLPHLFSAPIPPFSTQLWSWLYLQNVPATFTALHSSGPVHFWSLAVEEHFYMVWPLMVFLFPRPRFRLVVIATLLVPLLIRLVFVSHGIGVFYFTLTRMDSIGFGALLALWFTEEANQSRRRIPQFRFALVILPVALLPLFLMFSGAGQDWMQVVKLSLIPAFYCALIGFCIMDPMAKPLSQIFSIPALRWLGTISYGLYVFHPTCFDLVQRFLKPSNALVDYAASLGLTVLVAWLSFRFFESPITKLKDRFRYQPPKPGTAGSTDPVG
jgi:peptidoglycan/LPS O-acetylase OafA/YrhL